MLRLLPPLSVLLLAGCICGALLAYLSLCFMFPVPEIRAETPRSHKPSVVNRDCLKVIGLCLLSQMIDHSVLDWQKMMPLSHNGSRYDENQVILFSFFFPYLFALSLLSGILINANPLCQVLDKRCGTISERSPLIVKCLLIILWFRARRTHLLESLLHFPGEIEKKMSHIRTFFFFFSLHWRLY